MAQTFKLRLILWIRLDPQRRRKHELTHGGGETGKESVEWLEQYV